MWSFFRLYGYQWYPYPHDLPTEREYERLKNYGLIIHEAVSSPN
jgi:hypothetical protein